MHALWVVHLLTVPVWAWSSNALVLTQRGDETPWGVHFYSRQLRVDTRFPAYFLGWRPNWAPQPSDGMVEGARNAQILDRTRDPWREQAHAR